MGVGLRRSRREWLMSLRVRDWGLLGETKGEDFVVWYRGLCLLDSRASTLICRHGRHWDVIMTLVGGDDQLTERLEGIACSRLLRSDKEVGR